MLNTYTINAAKTQEELNALDEEFKCYSPFIKTAIFTKMLDEMRQDMRHALLNNSSSQISEEQNLEWAIIVRKYTGLFFRCLDDELAEDDEPMSNADECLWEASEEAQQLEVILGRICSEQLTKILEDTRAIQKIVEGGKLTRFIYVKEKK